MKKLPAAAVVLFLSLPVSSYANLIGAQVTGSWDHRFSPDIVIISADAPEFTGVTLETPLTFDFDVDSLTVSKPIGLNYYVVGRADISFSEFRLANPLEYISGVSVTRADWGVAEAGLYDVGPNSGNAFLSLSFGSALAGAEKVIFKFQFATVPIPSSIWLLFSALGAPFSLKHARKRREQVGDRP